jgi:hypothetical protein
MSKAKTRRARPPASTLRSKPAQCSIRHPEALPGSQPQSEPAGPSPMELAYAEWQQARAALQQVDIHAPVSSPALDEDERLQAYLGHRNIQNTTRYTALAPDRFKGFWKD